MTTTTLRHNNLSFARRFSWQLPAFVGQKVVRVLLLVLLVVMSVAYVAKVSALSGAGYQMHDMESKVSALKDETQKLEVAVASEQSMQNISKRVKDLGMVSPSTVQYIHAASGKVAER